MNFSLDEQQRAFAASVANFACKDFADGGQGGTLMDAVIAIEQAAHARGA